ncbi:MAG: DUF2635 domain-containing protein [Burkholderiaceae bacterium]|nr:DUF2635 domain-containing protein [Burkholderiaceae bacterium]
MSDDGRIFIKPTVQGGIPLKVRKPMNGHLATNGEWVNPESYWLRRIKDGDVEEAPPPADPVPAETGKAGPKAIK